MWEGRDAKGEGRTSEGMACTKATRPMGENARVSRAAYSGLVGDTARE